MRPLLRRVFQYIQSSPVYKSVYEDSRHMLLKRKQPNEDGLPAHKCPDRDTMPAATYSKPPSSASSAEMSDVEKPSEVYLQAPSLGSYKTHSLTIDDSLP